MTWQAWASLGYVSVFSLVAGMALWHRALAVGGVARIGRLQRLQPLFGLILAGFQFGEVVSERLLAMAALVAGCVAGARRYG